MLNVRRPRGASVSAPGRWGSLAQEPREARRSHTLPLPTDRELDRCSDRSGDAGEHDITPLCRLATLRCGEFGEHVQLRPTESVTVRLVMARASGPADACMLRENAS